MVTLKFASVLFVAVCLPLKNLVLTSGFGYRIHPISRRYSFHNGVDLRAQHDTVYSILDGVVKTAAYDSKTGLYLSVSHGNSESIYGHLSYLFVAARDTVYAGEPIGITGATGEVTGEHLHFAIRYRGRYIDPLQFLYQLLIKDEHEKEL
jgi:murein DD-endopeptidase MepM/ murein hydrolase activator NlpD